MRRQMLMSAYPHTELDAVDPKVDTRRSALRFISYGKFENVT